jgi:copper transport protein
LLLAGLGGLVLASAALLLVRAGPSGGLAGQGLPVSLGPAWPIMAARLALLALLAWLAVRAQPAGGGAAGRWRLAAALAAGLLLTFTLQSHSAALPGRQATAGAALDWLHLLGVAAWLGGLAPLALLLRRPELAPETKRALVPRFSRLAVASVAAIGLSGSAIALVQVRTLDALLATTYGRALLVKIALFALLFGLGAINRQRLSPRLALAGVLGRLRRNLSLELAIGALVLVAAGALTSVGPAFETLENQRRYGFVEQVRLGDVRLALYVAPLQAGDNEFAVDVIDDRPGAAAAAPTVLLRLQAPGGGTTQVELAAGEGGRFTTRGAYLSPSGLWQLTAIARRPGFDDARHTFAVPVPAPGPAGGAASENRSGPTLRPSPPPTRP